MCRSGWKVGKGEATQNIRHRQTIQTDGLDQLTGWPSDKGAGVVPASYHRASRHLQQASWFRNRLGLPFDPAKAVGSASGNLRCLSVLPKQRSEVCPGRLARILLKDRLLLSCETLMEIVPVAEARLNQPAEPILLCGVQRPARPFGQDAQELLRWYQAHYAREQGLETFWFNHCGRNVVELLSGDTVCVRFATISHHKGIDKNGLAGTETMHTPDALLHLHWVPRHIEMNEATGNLKVDALTPRP